MLGSMDSALPPKSNRPVSLRKPLRKLSLGQDPLPASPLISNRNLVPGLSNSVVRLDRLGKGATSNVFRAVHAATLKMVALKEVTVSTDADRRAVRTEMRALRTQRYPLLTSTFTTELDSCPRIVDYYGSVVQENGNACIAMEYVAGGSLGCWLDSGCRCPEAWIAHIAHQALEALDFVHSGGRVHRDVKPANILITRNGDLKLADFGAAGVENSSRMVGTQRFMAPERLKGHRATPQSDLWSLGASLAMSALGDGFLSQASNEFEQLDLAGNVRRTLAEATTISRQLADFLHQFLSRDPARRPALRELMKHRFLEQRYEWTKKCPEVPKAMRTRKRQQREDESALSTDEVLDALCRKRAENNLINSRVDPETAADLAYELGVTATSLVRDVHRRTLELIRAPGGGGGVVGVSDSGGDSEDKGNRGKGRYSLGMGYAAGCSLSSDAERIRYKRRNRRRRGSGGDGEKEDGERSRGKHGASRLGAVDSFGHTDSDPDTDEMLSPMKPPPLPEPSEQDWKPQPSAVVDSMDPNNTSNISCLPRTPRVSSTGGGGTTAFPGAPGTATPSGKSGSSSSRRTRRRPVEMSSSVKLTPHKRRGERRSSSQTKRSGHSCEADGTRARRSRSRRGRGHRERGTPKELTTTSASAHHIHGTTERDNLDGGGTAGYRRSVEREQVEEKPRTTESPTLPSRTDVPLRSTRGVFQLADKMKAEISVRNRCHRLQVYPDCFTGREAVQWMLEGGHASSVIDAEKLGNEMMKASVFQHILNSHVFEDSAVYYQFTDGETPPPPARGGQRLRQIARVFRGHVARKIVHHHHQGGGAFSSGNDSISGSGVGIGGGLDDEMSPAEEATHVCTSKRCMCPQEEGTGGGSEVGARDVAPRSIDASAATVFYSHRQQRPVHDSKKAISARSKHRNCRVPVRRHGNGVSQARRFSHSTSTVTVPETPC